MKNNSFENLIINLMHINSDKVSDEVKNKSAKALAKSCPFFATGTFLEYVDVNKMSFSLYANETVSMINEKVSVGDSSPLEALINITNLAQLNDVSSYLFFAGGMMIYQGVKVNRKSENWLANYGSDICPYNSYSDFKNDLRAKKLQININKIDRWAYHFDQYSFFRSFLTTLSNLSEALLKKASSRGDKVLNFFGASQMGFRMLTHNNARYNNPKFVEELPISKKLKDKVRPDLMDIGQEQKVDNRDFTLDVRKRANLNAENEIYERCINLALVKLIDKVKSGESMSKRDVKALNKACHLHNQVATQESSSYSDFNKVLRYVFFDLGINNFTVKNYNKEDDVHLRAYHIMRELDQVCYKKLKCPPLKKPMSYREIYTNELIMATQDKLRGIEAKKSLENRGVQDRSFLIKAHYENGGADEYSTIIRRRIKI